MFFNMISSQEYVASYPRPPQLDHVDGFVSIYINEELIAQDSKYIRVCETYHPPTIYLEPNAFKTGSLSLSTARPSFCEWKGLARYWNLSHSDGSDIRQDAGWSYASPFPPFRELTDWISVYPRLVDRCILEGEDVLPQPGMFYGGWITSWVKGPFKGDPDHPELI